MDSKITVVTMPKEDFDRMELELQGLRIVMSQLADKELEDLRGKIMVFDKSEYDGVHRGHRSPPMRFKLIEGDEELKEFLDKELGERQCLYDTATKALEKNSKLNVKLALIVNHCKGIFCFNMTAKRKLKRILEITEGNK